MNRYLHVLTSLCNKVHVQCHSEFIVLEEEKYCFMYEIPLNKKLSYHRGTARCVVSIEILPIAKQQCRNYLYDKS